VPDFPQRLAFTYQLHIEALLAPDKQPDIFHPGLPSVLMHWVVFVDQGFQLQSLPRHWLSFRQRMPESLCLHSTASSWFFSLKRGLPPLARGVLLHRFKGPCGDFLHRQCVQVLPQLAMVELLGIGVQLIIADEGRCFGFGHACLWLLFRDGIPDGLAAGRSSRFIGKIS
jgi:hypothetical protein